jgi:hypothetical protein
VISAEGTPIRARTSTTSAIAVIRLVDRSVSEEALMHAEMIHELVEQAERLASASKP